MRAELTLSLGTLFGFLLVLARVAGAFAFVPLPGLKSGPDAARVVLVLSLTLALFPEWPAIDASNPPVSRVAAWMIAEAGLGIAIGLAVSFLTEAFVLAAQVMGLQAGYAYASTIDPTTQADSGILLVLAQLIAGMLFFASSMDREIISVFAQSLQAHPPGTLAVTRSGAQGILSLGAEMFSTGVRLALPVVALVMMVDVALALLGRINAQLQLLTLAFPVKMLATLGLLAWMAVLFPAVYRGCAGHMLAAVREAFCR